MNDSHKFSSVMRTALDVADGITPSVLAVSKVVGVKPKDLAEVLADGEALSLYRNEVILALQPIMVKLAVEQEKEEKGKEA